MSCTAIILSSKISNSCRYFFEIRCVPIWVSDEITQDLNTVIFDQMLISLVLRILNMVVLITSKLPQNENIKHYCYNNAVISALSLVYFPCSYTNSKNRRSALTASYAPSASLKVVGQRM